MAELQNNRMVKIGTARKINGQEADENERGFGMEVGFLPEGVFFAKTPVYRRMEFGQMPLRRG